MPGSFSAEPASRGSGGESLRRTRIYYISAILLGGCLAGPLGAQAPPRTVRVSTGGCIGTRRSLTVTTGGAWRLIDLGDRRLVCEGAGRAEWRFERGSGSRVVARGLG